MNHEIVKCSCGEVIGQCRCFHKDKTVQVIKNACGKCASSLKQPNPNESVASMTTDGTGAD